MLQQVLEAYELLDDAYVNGEKVAELLKSRGIEKVGVKTIKGEKGSTDLIKVVISGKEGKMNGGVAPTLGIIGRLGGIGARPELIGMTSDADGATTAVSCALKLAEMKRKGDVLKGDVIITTNICPNAFTKPHDPVPFMKAPVENKEVIKEEVDADMDAILSIDTTKGNRIINHRGIAITPTVKEGYILKISEDLLNILTWTTGKPPRVTPITTQDITPYENGLYHMNSIMQPCIATPAPVVGVAVIAETAIPGCATGASQEVDIKEAGAFCIEVAKAFSEKKCSFYDEAEFERIVKLYGPMTVLQTSGKV
jgi:hypothetical protein